jgi:hypothetical protein
VAQNKGLILGSLGGGSTLCCCGGGGGGGISCSPCNIPTSNLTVSWTNPLTGNGSTGLTYNPGGSPTWTSGCADDGLLFELLCNAGNIELRAIYFTSGSCPTGTQAYCSNLLGVGSQLILSSYTCSPFSLTFTNTGVSCPTLYGDGNTQFVVTV